MSNREILFTYIYVWIDKFGISTLHSGIILIMSADGVVVRFIKNSEDPKIVELLEKAFLAVQEVCATSIWFNEEDCLELTKYEKYIFFVFGSFSGQAFEKIITLGNRVYGAPCILQCLETQEVLPKRTHPVYSLSMRGIVITCTNIPAEMRKEIHRKVEWMMGEATKVMNEKVNCLIAGEVGSKKYLVAGLRKNKIMLPDWVHAVWTDTRYRIVHASDERYDRFKCPMFKGFSLCASGLSPQERARIKETVEMEGGRFNGMMKVNECTHLVVGEPSGQKYQFARDWNIFTVKPEWVFDSIKTGYCLEESDYTVAPKKSCKTTSTPNKTGYECDISSISNLSSISVTHVDETEFTMRNDTFSSRTRPTQVVKNDLGTLDAVDVGHPSCDSYLNGCKIYLCGAALENSDKIRVLINKGNGTRFNQLNETISHVVTEVADEAIRQQLSKLPNKPHVVSPLWLVECFKQGRCLSEDAFRLIQNQPKDHLPQGLKATAMKTQMRKVDASENQENNLEIMTMYSQNTPQITCNEFGESTMMAAAKMVEEANKSAPNVETSATERTVMDRDGDENDNIFAGLTFVIFHREFMEELTKEIEEFGGKVLPLNSRKVANVGVVPIEGCLVTRTVDEIVTTAWVNMCIEESMLLPFDGLEIFKPLTILPNCQPLKDCVLSISGMQGLEKNIIIDILQLLGGRVQDCFVRVRKENFLACTHLVVNSPEGPKYEAAQKWGIPTVSKSWVFECARTGKKVPEKLHHFQQNEESRSTEWSLQSTKTKRPESPHITTTPNATAKPSKSVEVSKVVTPLPLRRAETTTEQSLQSTKTKRPESPLITTNATSKPSKSVEVSKTVTPLPPRRAETTLPASKGLPHLENKAPFLHPGSAKTTRVQALIESKKVTHDDTPSKFMSGNPYRPQFNFQNSLDCLQSPVVNAKPNARISLPLEEVFAENIKIALKNSTNGGGDDSFSQECSNITLQQPETKMPLSGVVISVCKKLIKNQTEYSKLAVELGAECRWSYSSDCTHFIFQGKENDANREFRVAREQGKVIVSPQWLKACCVQKKKVDEESFPHTYNGNISLTIVGAKTPARISKNPPKLTTSSPQSVPSHPGDASGTPVSALHLEQDDNTSSKEFINNLKKLTEASRSSRKGRHQAGMETPTSERNQTKENEKGSEDISHKVLLEQADDAANIQTKQDSNPPASQVEVTWEYSATRLEARENNCTVSSKMPRTNLQSSSAEEKLCSKHTGKKNLTFMLSGFKPQEREEYASLIESLGASVAEGSGTHLVSNNPSRSEKFLACVSSGKWVLHKSYLTACKEAGRFIEEEVYEWGSKNILDKHPSLNPQEVKLAHSAQSWRLKLQNEKNNKGAFSGWRCLLMIDPKKGEGFSRLLSTGGAVNISNKENWEEQGVTHAFIESKNISFSVDYEKMVALGVHCLKPEYIASCLTDPGQTDPKNFYVPEALLILNHNGMNKKRRSRESSYIAPKENKNRKLH